jgi:hypothetical protein
MFFDTCDFCHGLIQRERWNLLQQRSERHVQERFCSPEEWRRLPKMSRESVVRRYVMNQHIDIRGGEPEPIKKRRWFSRAPGR